MLPDYRISNAASGFLLRNLDSLSYAEKLTKNSIQNVVNIKKITNFAPSKGEQCVLFSGLINYK